MNNQFFSTNQAKFVGLSVGENNSFIILIPRISSNDIAPLLTGQRTVREIFFHFNDDCPPLKTFGFQNVLFSQGQNLRDVTLVGVDAISLSNLLIFCPILEILHLDLCHFTQNSEGIVPNAPCLLKSFRLGSIQLILC